VIGGSCLKHCAAAENELMEKTKLMETLAVYKP
jgi:hypothetical protein